MALELNSGLSCGWVGFIFGVRFYVGPAIATAEGNKQAEAKAKDAAAKEALADTDDLDDIDEEFDANESIPE